MSFEILYKRVFGVELAHEYFEGGVSTGLALEPSAACAAALAGNGCRFRNLPQGGEVWLGDADDSAPGPGEEPCFSFIIYQRDPQMENYTQPTWGEGKLPAGCLYFSNPAPGAKGSGDTVELAAGSGTPLPVLGRAFSRRFDQPLSGGTYSVQRERDGRECARQAAPPGSFSTVNLDLRELADGRYLLFLDGQRLLDFYLTDLPPERIFGILEISAGGKDAWWKQLEGKTFSIRLDARRPRWRYILMSRANGLDLSAASVTATPKSINFQKPVQENRRGRTAWIVASVDSIPLYQSPASHHQFDLHLPPASGKPAEPKRLPYAAPATTRPERHDDSVEWWSEIYVYL